MTINVNDIKTPNHGKFILHCLKVESNATFKPDNLPDIIKYHNLIHEIKTRISELENNITN